MKPWTERKQVASAMKNEHVRVGERELPGGGRLRGLYAVKDFAAGDYVASFHGRIIAREKLMELHGTDRALFNHINEYAVWSTVAKGHLYPESVEALGAHLINHACAPNVSWGQFERGALLVRALKPVVAGEELTVFYGWIGVKAAFENNRHSCACSALYCTGTIELFVEALDYGDGTGGPNLPDEEVTKRMLADIVNGTDEHEALMGRYAKESVNMIHGATVREPIDLAAFHEKLQRGAFAAVVEARRRQADGRTVSEKRLRQIVRDYDVPMNDSRVA